MKLSHQTPFDLPSAMSSNAGRAWSILLHTSPQATSLIHKPHCPWDALLFPGHVLAQMALGLCIKDATGPRWLCFRWWLLEGDAVQYPR